MGSLGDEKQHRTKQDGCDYEEIQCQQGCGVNFCRMKQQTHSVTCLLRPHKCEHCSEEGPYQCITGNHLETCRRYPVQCPNGCKVKIPREEVLSEVRLKEELSAKAQELQAKKQHVRQLEEDNRTKAQHIHNLERDTKVNRETIAQLTEAIEEYETQKRLWIIVIILICVFLPFCY